MYYAAAVAVVFARAVSVYTELVCGGCRVFRENRDHDCVRIESDAVWLINKSPDTRVHALQNVNFSSKAGVVV